ncbi:MAG: DNA recombination protein RmuC, partial [Kiritimatiellia bacterium]
MMDLIVYSALAVLFIVCMCLLCALHKAHRSESDASARMREWKARMEAEKEQMQRLLEEKEKSCQVLLASKEEACRQQIRLIQERYENQLKQASEQTKQTIADTKQSFERSVSALQEQFSALAQKHLMSTSQNLVELNKMRMDELMKPFKDELRKFEEAFRENTHQQVSNKASFEQAIADLGKQALQIGADAENLAKALKRESKTQGNWGEMVLANILETAGLREGKDFVTQATEYDEQNNRLIPDVEVLLPNKEKLLIDSKTSVTAYLDYVSVADDEMRKKHADAHVASVRKHMEELADKKYITKIKGSQGYILMFIPNEGSYLLAMERDQKLATDAFNRHVIIVNPTTLLLCLQIVALLRIREKRNENADKIFDAVNKMYDKFVTFAESFAVLEKSIKGISDAYDRARMQLSGGKGNLVRRVEALRELGISPAKKLPEPLLESSGVNPEEVD